MRFRKLFYLQFMFQNARKARIRKGISGEPSALGGGGGSCLLEASGADSDGIGEVETTVVSSSGHRFNVHPSLNPQSHHQHRLVPREILSPASSVRAKGSRSPSISGSARSETESGLRKRNQLFGSVRFMARPSHLSFEEKYVGGVNENEGSKMTLITSSALNADKNNENNEGEKSCEIQIFVDEGSGHCDPSDTRYSEASIKA